jgi:hypothetical protein
MSTVRTILAVFCGSGPPHVVESLHTVPNLSLECHNALQGAGVNEKLNSLFDVRLAGVALLSKRAQGGTGKLIEGVKRGVQGPWGFVRRCCFLTLPLALAACTSLSGSFDVTPFLREQITGDTWRACLAREYQVQARSEVRAGRKWAGAIRLATKGQSALDGAQPEPESAPDFAQDRARLLGALANRDQNTCDCAKAQARFDGLIVKADRGADIGPVNKSFNEALAACAPSR